MAGDELDLTDQMVGQAAYRRGPVWEGLLQQVVEAQGEVPVIIGTELIWAWEEDYSVVEPPVKLAQYYAERVGGAGRDSAHVLGGEAQSAGCVRSGTGWLGEGWQWALVSCLQGIEPVFGMSTGTRTDGLGAVRVCTLPSTMLGDKMILPSRKGVGACERARGTCSGDLGGRLDKREVMAWEMAKEWIGDRLSEVWCLDGGLFGKSRGQQWGKAAVG